MNRTLLSVLGLAFATAIAGCGAAPDAEGQGAEFPESPGTDEAPRGASETGALSSQQQPIAQVAATEGASQPQSAQFPTREVPVGSDVEDPAGEVQVGAADPNEYVDTDPSALTDFRPALDPYGSWVDDPTYGTVWVPSTTVVGADFTPYVTAGHWAYEDDWVWVSDYEWGWAPFHYGRWTYIGGRGWGWIPGRTYAGAWVSWRYGYDGYGYIGWAPLAPTWYWRGGYPYGIAVVPRAPYVFCGYGDVFRPRVGGYVVTGPAVAQVASHTRPYVPASPTVNGSGRVAAHPGVGGPSPQSLGIHDVARVPMGDRGLMHATQFAHPSTATAYGAHAPVQARPAPNAYGVRSYASNDLGARAMAPTYGGYSRGAVATGPRYQGVAPSRTFRAPSYGSYGAYGHYSSMPGGYAAPHYGAVPGGYSAPHYGASPVFGHYGGAAHLPTNGTVSHAPAPSWTPPAAASHSGGFRGGGFRGGGGGHVGGGRR